MATPGNSPRPVSIFPVQAGTGTGESLACLVPRLPMCLPVGPP
jgi:hypothetical protein